MTNEKGKIGYKDLILPIISLLVGLVTVLSTNWTQTHISDSSLRIKELEITYKDKKENYVAFIASLKQFIRIIEAPKEEAFNIKRKELEDKIRSALIALDPFLPKNLRGDLWRRLEALILEANNIYYANVGAGYMSEEFRNNKKAFVYENEKFIQNELRDNLFAIK